MARPLVALKSRVFHAAFPLLFVVAACAGAEYRLDAAKGADANDGSAEHPWSTLAKAVAALQAGDTLLIASGTYTAANLPFKASGKPGAPIVLRGSDDARPVLRAGGAGNVFLLGDVSHVTLEHLEFAEFKGQPINAKANSAEGGNWITVRNCLARGGDIFVKANSNKFRAHHLLVEGCTALEMGDIPLFIDNLDAVVLRHNVLYGSKSVALDPGGVADLVVENNFCVCTGRLGALKIRWGNVEPLAGPNCRGAIVRRNVFLEGGRYAILLASANGAAVYQNVLANVKRTPLESGLLFCQLDAVDIEPGKPNGPNKGNAIRNNIFYLQGGDEMPNTWTTNALVRLDGTMTASLADQDFNHNLYYKAPGANYLSVDKEFVTKEHVKGWGSGYDKESLAGDDPLFTAPDAARGPEGFRPGTGSPALDGGAPLTTVAGTGRGQVLPVKNAGFFTGGAGLIPGDRIRIAGGEAVRVTGRDLAKQTLTLEREMAWEDGQPVALDYAGRAPDLGAYEEGQAVQIGNSSGIEWVRKRLEAGAGK